MLISLAIVFAAAIFISLKDLREAKRIQSRPPLCSFYDTVPDVPLETLQPSRREKVLRRLNLTKCDCQCALTLAQCRNTDRTCQRSVELALRILNAPSR